MHFSRFVLPVFLLLLQATQLSYEQGIEQWQRTREAALKAEGGWLDVAGLFWLKPGANTVGTDTANDLVLPKGSAPPNVGRFWFAKGEVIFEPQRGVMATVNGKPAARQVMKPDASGSPDILRLGSLTMFAIRRGTRTGVRLKDSNNPARKNFAGLKYFPTRPSYRVKAKYSPYDPPRKIKINSVLGDTSEDVSPGYLEFDLGGKHLRLEPLIEDDELFIIFRDQTAGRETYPAGRFLYADLPKSAEVILDFNKAINPPCAFTPYTTCPLPPPQNRLAIRIEAGELRYGH
ncbi:MAG: DUF1684 domain-containing protein [Acidobacteria bacterium]|nr:DUF1684 domain-containing protein [Acidobacteriota bacterium]